MHPKKIAHKALKKIPHIAAGNLKSLPRIELSPHNAGKCLVSRADAETTTKLVTENGKKWLDIAS